MHFGYAEVARARTLKATGLVWHPKVGDWYVDHTGFCDLVRSPDDATRLGRNGDVFLPSWQDGRAWLRARGWSHPEVIHEDDGSVHLVLSHAGGATLKAVGVSELDSLYRIMLMVQLSTPVRGSTNER